MRIDKRVELHCPCMIPLIDHVPNGPGAQENGRLEQPDPKWSIWGSGDFRHWWNLDPGRPHKAVALEIDVGRRIVPTITPDDPNAVERILGEHLNHP
jgi:hypothetical protein